MTARRSIARQPRGCAWLAASLFLSTLLTAAIFEAQSASAQQGQQPKQAARPTGQQRGTPPGPPADAEPRPQFDYEGTFYWQPRLLDHVLKDVRPSDPDKPGVFFVGFAGWGDQDVFIREVVKTRDIVEERFGAHGRTVLLINHPLSVDHIPLATVTNLDYVLRDVGRRMRPEKDVLVLFLTSHGIENLFAVQLRGYSFNNLTPRTLAAILERSGIKKRVVIISACHSGSFIPALETDNTVIMTAARADRASFGCSNTAHWTYFGDALVNRALRTTANLPEAFASARDTIARWEREQRLSPPSEPQMFVGKGAAPVIEMLAKRTGN